MPFIPTRGQEGVRLVSLRTARSSSVYLSDAGAMGEVIVSKDRRVLLAIDHVKEVTEPISESLHLLGVKSLRETLGEPESVAGSGDVTPVSENLLAQFRELQSKRFGRTFRKRLNELGVELGLVRRNWHDRLSHVQEIKFATEVEARYRFSGRSYLLAARAGFDPASGIFWVRRDHDIESINLYESLAKHLIFKPAARPIDLLALERTVDLEVRDPSFGRPADLGSSAGHDDTAEQEHPGEAEDQNGDPGEAPRGHSPFRPDPSRNRPQPGPIPTRTRGSPAKPQTPARCTWFERGRPRF